MPSVIELSILNGRSQVRGYSDLATVCGCHNIWTGKGIENENRVVFGLECA